MAGVPKELLPIDWKKLSNAEIQYTFNCFFADYLVLAKRQGRLYVKLDSDTEVAFYKGGKNGQLVWKFDFSKYGVPLKIVKERIKWANGFVMKFVKKE